MARFCFITHQKGRMLRAPAHQRGAGGLHSCEGYGITGGTSTEQMSQIKNERKKEKKPASLGSWARPSGARPDAAQAGLLGGTLAFSTLLTVIKVQLATALCRPLGCCLLMHRLLLLLSPTHAGAWVLPGVAQLLQGLRAPPIRGAPGSCRLRPRSAKEAT